jgi:hypothetical protein
MTSRLSVICVDFFGCLARYFEISMVISSDISILLWLSHLIFRDFYGYLIWYLMILRFLWLSHLIFRDFYGYLTRYFEISTAISPDIPRFRTYFFLAFCWFSPTWKMLWTSLAFHSNRPDTYSGKTQYMLAPVWPDWAKFRPWGKTVPKIRTYLCWLFELKCLICKIKNFSSYIFQNETQ